MTKGNSSNRKEMTKEGILEHQEVRTMGGAEIDVYTIDHPSLHDF